MIDHVALAAEINTNPEGITTRLGNLLPAAVIALEWRWIAEALNKPKPVSPQQTSRGRIPVSEVLEAIDWNDLVVPAAEDRIMRVLTLSNEAGLDVSNPRIVAGFATAFAGTPTLTRLQAIRDRDMTRAEELFGVGEVVTRRDVMIAVNAVVKVREICQEILTQTVNGPKMKPIINPDGTRNITGVERTYADGSVVVETF